MRAAVAIVLSACTARVAVIAPDAAPDAATTQTVSGTALDYVAGSGIAEAMISTEGIALQTTATATGDGAFSLQVPIGATPVVAVFAQGYRTTRNLPLVSPGQDVFAMAVADVEQQYAAVSVTEQPNAAFLAIDLVDPTGAPVEGIPTSDVQLLDANQQPVSATGPYFYGSGGNLDPTVTKASAYGVPPRSRAAFLNVPAGTFGLAVTYVATSGPEQDNTQVTTASDSVTLAKSSN